MENKIRILQVTSGFRQGVSGGIPSVLHNYCTAGVFEKKVHFDYLALGYQTFEPYRADFEKRGGKLFCLNIHSSGLKQLVDIYIYLKKFLKTHRYDIVHVNSGALTQVLSSCKAAKDAGINIVIAHSHNAIKKQGLKGKLYNFLKNMFYGWADAWFACSEVAAKSMFPTNIIDEKRWTLIPNAIDMERFTFSEEVRNHYRANLGLEGKYVIGHVGRFNNQKNHIFLIEIFAEVIKIRQNAVLLLVGAGDLMPSIKEQVALHRLSEKVIFAGQRQDANALMQAMDVFVFPSLFEGLGMVLIEAQVSGMSVLTSDTIPGETKISDNISYISLEDKDEWVYKLLTSDNSPNRVKASYTIRNDGKSFDLWYAANSLCELYIEIMNNNKINKLNR